MVGDEKDVENGRTAPLLDKQRRQPIQKFAVNMSVYDIADILSSLSFLIGSILFYPCFDTPKGVDMMLVAAWLFIVGSVLMLLVMVQDMKIIVSALRKLEVVDDISALPIQQMQRQRSTTFQLLNNGTVSIWEIRNAVLYITSGILFVIGAAFFHPYLYAKCAYLGLSLFISGIILQLVAVVWDTARFLVQGERKSSKDVWILFLPAFGLSLFLIGCLHFYPRFQRDDFDVYYSASYFVVGSVFFLISSLMKVVVLNKEYGAQEATTTEGCRHSQTLLLRRRAISIRCNSIIL